MDDALAAVAQGVEPHAELGAVSVERLELDARELVGLARPGRHVVVGGGKRAIGAADAPSRQPQPLECLCARHLVNQVQVDVDEAVSDLVIGPDLVKHRAGRGGHAGILRRRVARGAAGYVRGMATTQTSQGILGDAQSDARDHVIELLTKAYWMEVETVMSYLAASVNPDGVRAREIVESLEEDVDEELGHARQFAARIKELYGVVPGSKDFSAEQSFLQPPEHQTDIVHIIRGVIEAETGAIEHYTHVIEETEGIDPVTQDMVIGILRDEQGHRRLFEGYLREFEAEGTA